MLHGERPEVPPDMPEPYSLLMTSCWAPDATARPPFERVSACLRLMLQELSQSGEGGGGGPEAGLSGSSFVQDL